MVEDVPRKVLVVEDEPALASLYREWLDGHYDVQVVTRGEAALRSIGDAVDVVLLDRRMPDRSGDDVLAEIRERGIDCRVAMVTAVTPDVDVLELGFDDYLVKPVSRADVHEVVEGLIRRTEYDAALQEYFALVSKQAVLEAEADRPLGDPDPARARIEAALRSQSRALADSLRELDVADFEAMFHDLGDRGVPGEVG